MNNHPPALIWDLDGTLLDSYPMIVESLYRFYAARCACPPRQQIRRFVLTTSVRDFAAHMARKTGVQLYDELADYRAIRADLERDMAPMPGARAVLEAFSQRGVTHDVVTHRGASTRAVLERTGLWGCFRAILTAEDGFPRKPDPAAIVHLMQVYRLDPARTFYVGDRSLDMDCADRAGIGSILFHPADNPTPVPADRLVVTSLPELLTLPELSL